MGLIIVIVLSNFKRALRENGIKRQHPASLTFSEYSQLPAFLLMNPLSWKTQVSLSSIIFNPTIT